jgi:hypothetical protein
VQRVEVARLLLSLASSSSLIRDELEEDAEKKKALRRELNDLRIKIRRCAPISPLSLQILPQEFDSPYGPHFRGRSSTHSDVQGFDSMFVVIRDFSW